MVWFHRSFKLCFYNAVKRNCLIVHMFYHKISQKWLTNITDTESLQQTDNVPARRDVHDVVVKLLPYVYSRVRLRVAAIRDAAPLSAAWEGFMCCLTPLVSLLELFSRRSTRTHTSVSFVFVFCLYFVFSTHTCMVAAGSVLLMTTLSGHACWIRLDSS